LGEVSVYVAIFVLSNNSRKRMGKHWLYVPILAFLLASYFWAFLNNHHFLLLVPTPTPLHLLLLLYYLLLYYYYTTLTLLSPITRCWTSLSRWP
jgi:hypothetical protein